MKKNLTEIVFILDRSGSMYSLTDDTIGGFYSLMDSHKKEEGEFLVSTLLFNHETEVIHNRENIKDIPYMTKKDYHADGSTALYRRCGKAYFKCA